MIDTTIAPPGQKSTTREERDRRLYAKHAEEIRFGRGVWLVPSEHDLASVYEVRVSRGQSCERKDFEFNPHCEPCKHIRAVLQAEANRADQDLRIDYPVEEELLAVCEYALDWFEKWEEHADHEHDFGGEHAVMKKLRRAIRIAREEA